MMGNYSLQSMDPELMRQVMNYVQPSPYRNMRPEDQQRVVGVLDRMSGGGDLLPAVEGGDWAHGVASPIRENTDDTVSKAFRIGTGILTSPLRLLGEGFKAFEGAIGHPNAMRRESSQYAAQALDRQMLLDKTLTPAEKLAMGFSPEDVTWGINVQANRVLSDPTANATGRDLASMPTMPTRQTGLWELISGEDRKQQAEQAGRIQAYQQMLADRAERAKIESEQQRTSFLKSQTQGQDWENQQHYQYDDANSMAKLDQIAAQTGLTRAQIQNLYADNARADAAAGRAAAGDARDETMAEMRMRLLREELRGKKIDNRTAAEKLRAMLDPSGGLSLDIIKTMNSANSPGEKISTASALGVPMTEVVTKPGWLGSSYGQTTELAPDYSKFTKQTDQSVVHGVDNNQPTQVTEPRATLTPSPSNVGTNHPRFAEFYNKAKARFPAEDDSYWQGVALVALKQALGQ